MISLGLQPVLLLNTAMPEYIVSNPELLMLSIDKSGSQGKRRNLGRFLHFYREKPTACGAMLITESGSTLVNDPQNHCKCLLHVIVFSPNIIT